MKIELTEERSARAQIASAAATLRERVPHGWQVDVVIEPSTAEGQPDAIVTVTSPDGASADVVIDYKTRIDPANVGPR